MCSNCSHCFFSFLYMETTSKDEQRCRWKSVKDSYKRMETFIFLFNSIEVIAMNSCLASFHKTGTFISTLWRYAIKTPSANFVISGNNLPYLKYTLVSCLANWSSIIVFTFEDEPCDDSVIAYLPPFTLLFLIKGFNCNGSLCQVMTALGKNLWPKH